MRRMSKILIILVILADLSFSQNSLRFDFSRLAWGYNFGMLTIEPTIFNTNLDTMQITNELGTRMPMNGFGGWISVNDRWRVGALGMIGNMLVSGQSDSTGVFRQVDFNLKFAGPTLETVFRPKSTKNLEVTLGGMLAFGHVSLRSYGKGGSNATWKDFWRESSDDSITDEDAEFKANLLELTANTIILYPWLGLRYSDFLGVMTVGLEAGYMIGEISEEDWRMVYGKISNAEACDLSNLMLRMTVYLGN